MRWRLRYKVSLRDLAEMFLERGFCCRWSRLATGDDRWACLLPSWHRQGPGSEVIHRCTHSLQNRLEQDHRGIKQRDYPMGGFGSVELAAHFCYAFDEMRQFLRVRTTMKQSVSLAQQREVLGHRLDTLKVIVWMA